MRRYTAGDRVVQAQYGAGTIVDVNEHHAVIEFDEVVWRHAGFTVMTLLRAIGRSWTFGRLSGSPEYSRPRA